MFFFFLHPPLGFQFTKLKNHCLSQIYWYLKADPNILQIAFVVCKVMVNKYGRKRTRKIDCKKRKGKEAYYILSKQTERQKGVIGEIHFYVSLH